jgi:predicted dehydrogenase
MQRSLAALTVGAGLPAWYAREVFALQQEQQQPSPAANTRINLGAIGIGSPQSRGRQIANAAISSGKDTIRYVAICDVDGRHRQSAVNFMKNNGQGEVKEYRDYREMLDSKEIDAVTIAVPDHWHALVAIEALRKGKDVYCEKPLTLTIAEGQALAKVAKETGRIFQVGTQQRSEFGGRFRLATELVLNGRLGKIKKIETRVGANPTSPSLPKVDPPKELDWDFWLGPTPMVDYVETMVGKQVKTRCHYEFRWWYEYSGGKMTDWGAHHNDIAQWALGMDGSGPISVEAEGKEPSKEPNSYNCHPQFKVTYGYANGTQMVCSDRAPETAPQQTRQGDGNGILFVGDNDQWIFVSRNTIIGSDEKLVKEPLPANATKVYPSSNHMANFLDCVRTRKPTICPADVGHRSVTVCHLGVIALRSGKKLKWDPVKEVFDDADANKMLSREYRAPWKLTV